MPMHCSGHNATQLQYYSHMLKEVRILSLRFSEPSKRSRKQIHFRQRDCRKCIFQVMPLRSCTTRDQAMDDCNCGQGVEGSKHLASFVRASSVRVHGVDDVMVQKQQSLMQFQEGQLEIALHSRLSFLTRLFGFPGRCVAPATHAPHSLMPHTMPLIKYLNLHFIF